MSHGELSSAIFVSYWLPLGARGHFMSARGVLTDAALCLVTTTSNSNNGNNNDLVAKREKNYGVQDMKTVLKGVQNMKDCDGQTSETKFLG
eukprot:2123852-Amphidinium_carterae.1